MDSMTSKCRELASPNTLNFILSIVILFGILISYAPQHARIISLRSSFGISPFFVLLGATSGTSSFANILTLPKTSRDVSCCREISGISCFATLLGIFQVGVQWLCFVIVLLLFVIYFPRATSPTSPVVSGAAPTRENKPPTYKTALIVSAISLLHATAVALVSVTLNLRYPSSLQAWADFLGVTAAILASIQYLPQIYTTLRLRCVGSLSIPTMCVQTPGSFVWAASLAARLGKEGWSTWGVYLVTACLQGSLLVMAVYFELSGPKTVHRHGQDQGVKDVRNGVEADESGGDRRDDGTGDGQGNQVQASEETPLLQGH